MVKLRQIIPLSRWGRILAPPLLLSACTAAPAPTASARHPSLVSLNPCSDAILAEVADPAQILAISSYSQDPASSSMDLATARRFRATSGSVEEVLALHPDLVIGSTFMGPPTTQALHGLGLRLEQFGIASSVAESEAQVRRIAVLAGHPERGEALVARIEAALAANRAPPGPRPSALVWQGGGIVPGPDTLIAELLVRTGYANAVATRGLHQADLVSLEAILADPPQLVFVAGNGLGNDDRMLHHPALEKVSSMRREAFEPKLLWCGGPSIIGAANRLGAVRRSL